jgi:hypothetical protein
VSQVPVKFASKAIHAAVFSFSPGTSCGPSGLRAEHLKELILSDASDQMLDSLAALVSSLASGRAIDPLRQLLGGARLIAINKKDPGSVRPIAIGEILRRLTGKVVLASIATLGKAALGSNQFGVGVPNGSERITHLVRNACRNPPKGTVLLKVDVKNAFNSASRAVMLSAVGAHVPQLLPWAQWLYGVDSTLFFGSRTVRSSLGVQQGDPLGPLLFSLVIRDTLHHLDTLGLTLNLWYLDDGVIAGPAATVHEAYSTLVSRFGHLGLSINADKCELVSFDEELALAQFDAKIKRLRHNFDILGTPIGDDAYVHSYILRKSIDKVQNIAALLRLLPEPHVRYTLLRQCVAFAPFVHIMRTVPPQQSSRAAVEYDAVLRRSLDELLGQTRISDRSWVQASLSVKKGGLGLRQCQYHILPAFLASSMQCSSADEWDPLECEAFSSAKARFLVEYPSATIGPSQRALSDLVDDKLFGELVGSARCRRDCARLRSVAGPDAGAFWNAVPSEDLRLRLPAAHFRISLRWWLGEAIYATKHSCPRCGEHCDVFGYHSLVCRHGGNLGVRHNSVRNVVLHAAKVAAMSPRIEQRVLPGSNSRPADLLLPCTGGHGTVCDFAVTHPLQDSFVAGVSDGTLDAAEAYALAHKTSKYEEAVKAEGYEFAPCVVDAFGNWCAAGIRVLASISEAASCRDGRSASLHLRLLKQRCAIALQLSNARALLQREDPGLLDDDALPEDTWDQDGDESAAADTSKKATDVVRAEIAS